MVTIDGAQVRRYRLARHRLDRRAPAQDLLDAAGAIGVQHTPPGSAAQALHARLTDLTPDDVAGALHTSRTLVQVWSARGAPHVVPVADADVFTAGLRPDDEESCLHFIRGAADHLARFELTATEAVDLVLDALPDVLGEKQLTKDELGVTLAERIERHVPTRLHTAWRERDGLGENTYGQSLVRFALYVAGLHGAVCMVPQDRGATRFALPRHWLGAPWPTHTDARAELVRRYLRCHGPSDATAFAAWSGASPAYAKQSFALLDGELAEVDYEGRPAFARRADLDLLTDPPRPAGVRLLPPYDPLLATRDRACLVPDPARRKQVWRTIGNPGALLAGGEVAGVWRPRKQGNRLTLRMEPFTDLPGNVRDDIAAEAAALAPFRGATKADVGW